MRLVMMMVINKICNTEISSYVFAQASNLPNNLATQYNFCKQYP